MACGPGNDNPFSFFILEPCLVLSSDRVWSGHRGRGLFNFRVRCRGYLIVVYTQEFVCRAYVGAHSNVGQR